MISGLVIFVYLYDYSVVIQFVTEIKEPENELFVQLICM